MEVKTTFWVKSSYIYILLPILIFFIGYCNLPTAIIGCSVTIIGTYFLFKNAPALWKPQGKKEYFLLFLAFIISCIWVYSSGIGALVFQNPDHNCRNPIFELLVSEPWPVVNENGSAILTYYIGFWFVPAIIGKIFNSIDIGYYAQIAWASVGVFLVFYYLLASLKEKNILPIFVFILFSGLDIVGIHLLHGTTYILEHKEWWSKMYQFSSFTTQLYWVFNQAIPAWLLTFVLYHQKNNKNIIFLYTTLFLSSTLPAVGLFPFVVYFLLKNGKNDNEIFSKKHIFNAIKSAITFENIASIFVIFLVTYLFLSANISGGKIYAKLPAIFVFVYFYLPFILLEVGVFLLGIFDIYKKNLLWYITTFCFLVYPLIYVGNSADFCMRATIPALIVLVLLFIQALQNEEMKKKKILWIVLIFSFFLGTITPLSEISRTIYMTKLGNIKAPSALGFENFFGYVENNRFLKYFGKKISKN